MTCSTCPTCGAKCEADHKLKLLDGQPSTIHSHLVKTVRLYRMEGYRAIIKPYDLPIKVWHTHNWSDSP